MKVITEEDFGGLLFEVHGNKLLIDRNELIAKFKELDQLTVSKLRPMSEAPKEGEVEILVKIIDIDSLQIAYYFEGRWVEPGDKPYEEGSLQGWLPMPIYKREQS